MARSRRKRRIDREDEGRRPRGPISKQEYIEQTLALCNRGRCCRDAAMLDAAYEQYVNNPRAPWNKDRRR